MLKSGTAGCSIQVSAPEIFLKVGLITVCWVQAEFTPFLFVITILIVTVPCGATQSSILGSPPLNLCFYSGSTLMLTLLSRQHSSLLNSFAKPLRTSLLLLKCILLSNVPPLNSKQDFVFGRKKKNIEIIETTLTLVLS